MNDKQIKLLLLSASTLGELNVMASIKMFVQNVLPNAKTREEIIGLLLAWLDLNIEELEKRGKLDEKEI